MFIANDVIGPAVKIYSPSMYLYPEIFSLLSHTVLYLGWPNICS